ncbi:fungal-specific transcription factor domain-containing protein [Ustulina deusta]|nr:fungal-specific transcription factor domain-containing protein [Ustulina deusta]
MGARDGGKRGGRPILIMSAGTCCVGERRLHISIPSIQYLGFIPLSLIRGRFIPNPDGTFFLFLFFRHGDFEQLKHHSTTVTPKTMAGLTNKEVVDELEIIDISNQENVSRRANTLRRNSKQHIRHRASVACYSCRDRRIRCVVPKGAPECTQCKRSGTECVIKMDDERRRPISKAYVSSLSARIGLLESMLEEKGVLIPPATHPPATRHEAQPASSGDETRISSLEARRRSKSDASSTHRHVLSPPCSHEDFAMPESPMEDLVRIDVPQPGKELLQRQYSLSQKLDLKQEDVMDQLLFPDRDLLCDQLPRKLQLFGPTASYHVYAEPLNRYDVGESPEQIRRAERIIRSLTPKTHDYLMQNFWKHQNDVLQVVDRAAFEADRGSENPKFYSSFLHVVMLALGWRFANKDRCDIARINLGNHESAIHREAKYMLEKDLERPMGISSVQSLLLLGDLECGVGRDNTGWMYAGMANRLAFDIGLHVDCSSIGLPDQEVRVRRRVMKACVLYDKYWALFLGRATSLKSRDIGFDLSKAVTSTIHSYGHNTCVSADTETIEEIYEQLFELMGLAGRIVENRSRAMPSHSVSRAASFTIDEAEKNSSADMSILDRQLRDWYQRLPSHLAWGPDNIRTAPSSYFLLHEQYHALVILLHRSREAHGLASNDEPTSLSPSSPNISEVLGDARTDNSTKAASSVCTKAAIQFAQVVSQSKEKCDFRKICYTSLQPAGIASIALLTAIAQCKEEADRRIYLSSLEVLSDVIRGMSRSYQPATRMRNLIQAALAQLHLDMRNYRDDPGNPWERDANRCKGDGGARQRKATDLFPSFPANREHYGGGQFLPNNERACTIGTQVGSESAKPRLSSHALSGPSHSQYPTGDHLNIMYGFVPAFSDSPDSFLNLDSLHAMSVNSIYSNHGILPSRYGSDNYLRVAPSAKGWGLHSLHAASQLEQPSPDLDSQMLDWVGGSATALHEPKFSTENSVLSTGLGSDLDTKSMSGCKREDSASLGWMNSERGASAPTPTSSKDSVQSFDKTGLNHISRYAAALPRNYELDYLSL